MTNKQLAREDGDAGFQYDTRYHHSLDRDEYYRIDAWRHSGAGSIVPKEWEQVPADQVPPEHRADVLERDVDEW